MFGGSWVDGGGIWGGRGGGVFWGIYVISSPSIRVTKPATHVGLGDVNNFIPITTFLTAPEAFIKFLNRNQNHLLGGDSLSSRPKLRSYPSSNLPDQLGIRGGVLQGGTQ